MNGQMLKQLLNEMSDVELLRPIVVFDGVEYSELSRLKYFDHICYTNVVGTTERRSVIGLE